MQLYNDDQPFNLLRLRSESHIDFWTQCVIMTLVGGGWGWGWAIINEVSKFRKVIEFESSYIVICSIASLIFI